VQVKEAVISHHLWRKEEVRWDLRGYIQTTALRFSCSDSNIV